MTKKIKCARCHQKLTEKTTAYYRGKPYCQDDCYSRTKYEKNHLNLEEVKIILKQSALSRRK